MNTNAEPNTQAQELISPEEELTHRQIRSNIFQMVWPATVESCLQMLVGLMASSMVGHIGAEAVSITSLGGRISQIIWSILFAVSTGATVLVARAVGARDRDASTRVANQALVLGIFVVVVLSLLAFFGATPIIQMLFHPQAALLAGSASYLRLVVWGAPFMGVMQIVGALLRGSGNTKVPMQIAFLVNVINVPVSFLLIYGGFGVAGMGVMGAALGSIVAQVVGAALSLYAISRPNKPVTIRLRELQPPHWKPIASILNVGVPAAMESLYWQLATVVITGIIVQFGEISLAAHQLGLNAESLSYMPSNGFGIAATAFVGQSLGARKPEQARRYIAEILKWGVYLTIVTASMLMFMPGVLMGLLTGDPEVIRLGSIYLRLMALVQLPQIISGVLGGAMRGGGDVRAPMVISGIGIWVFRIPLAFMFTRVLHMNVVGVWVAMTIDLFVRVSLNLYRFRQGKWHSRPVGIDV